jgi:dephospho-CoA kinase
MFKVGRRIVVCGRSDSGKTTVARQIAKSIGIPHIELDALLWEPHGVRKPVEESLSEVLSLISKHTDGWVFDGIYQFQDIILPLADTVVWIQLPFRVHFWRLMKRNIHWWRGHDCHKRIRRALEGVLKQLYIIINHHKRIRRVLERIPPQASIIQLRSFKEINAFLGGLCPTIKLPKLPANRT